MRRRDRVSSTLVDGHVALPTSPHQLVIDFMYLGLETCTRCRGTDANLELALAEVGRVLEATGAALSVRKTLVASAAQAQMLGFLSSPTIRVNGKDIALELRESSCDECGEACACDGGIDCREWVWQGEEHKEAPTAMIVDAILREVYGAGERAIGPVTGALPENLDRFFAGKEQLPAAAASCCSPTEQTTCCEPSQKASCCGEAVSGSCGCQ